MKNIFAASSGFVSSLQIISLSIAVAGFWIFNLGVAEVLTILLGYFLYSGVGVSMMMHRYWTHKSFQFKHPILEWLFSWFAIQAGRGSILGWVHIHREHHAYSDTEKDPHAPNINGWRVFFPHILNYGGELKRYLIRDLFTYHHLWINKYYKILVIGWAVLLFLISPWLFYFAWAVPLAMTHLALNSFTYFGHSHGYTNHQHRDESKNLWPFAILLWGEGWHNNHHANPSKWNLQERWWEIDLISYVIRIVKK